MCKDSRVKRSHSFDYLPDPNSNSLVKIKIEDGRQIYLNEDPSLNNTEDKQHVLNCLNKYDPKIVQLERPSRLIDNRNSSNQPLQNKVDSFVVSSANNSFVREYNDNDWYSTKRAKSNQKNNKLQIGSEYDNQYSRIHTRASDLSGQQEISRIHRRIASEDLILEESSDGPRIDYQKSDEDFLKDLSNIFKDIRYIINCCDFSIVDDQYLNSFISYAPKFTKEILPFSQEIIKIISKRIDIEMKTKDQQIVIEKLKEDNQCIKRDMELLKNSRYAHQPLIQPERDTNEFFKEKETLLLEKEYRLKLQEELNSKSDLLSNALLENEKLRKDIMQANYSKQTRELMISNEYLNDKIKNDLLDNLSRIEALKHEVEGLRYKLIEKERYIEEQKREHSRLIREMEEKSRNEYHEMLTKVKMEMGEEILNQKEKSMKLKSEADSLQRRNGELSSDYTSKNKRLKQLEEQCKLLQTENNEIKNEYVFEQRNVEKWHRNNLEMTTAVSAKDKEKRKLENRIKELERKYEEKEQDNGRYRTMIEDLKQKCSNQNVKDRQEIDQLSIVLEKLKANLAHKESMLSDERDIYSDRIKKLREENLELKSLLQDYQTNKEEVKSNIKYNNQLNKRLSIFNCDTTASDNLSNTKLKGLIVEALYSKHELKQKASCFIKMFKNSNFDKIPLNTAKKLDFLGHRGSFNEIKSSNTIDINELNRYKELFLSIISKIMRKLFEDKPISLIFENINLGDSFSKIIPGLKSNRLITELNINNTGLNDITLNKLTRILKEDRLINTLKIGYNNFSSASLSRLFETLKLDNMCISKIDVSGLNFNKEAITKLKDFLNKRSFIKKITIKNIINLTNKNSELEKAICELISVFKTMAGLKSLNISENKFNITIAKALFEELYFCTSIAELRVSNIGLYQHQDSDAFESLVTILSTNKQYECFDVSKNNLSNSAMLTILTLFCEQPNLIDLNLSEQYLDDKCSKMLAKLLQTNKKIEYLDLSDCHLSFFNSKLLIKPISESINIRFLNLDINNLTDTFLSEFCNSVKGLTQKDFKSYEDVDAKEYDEFTINASSEEEKSTSSRRFGLCTLSLENNKITDEGVETLCELLVSKSYFIRKLSVINLQQNQITQRGTEMINRVLEDRREYSKTSKTNHIEIFY